MPLDLLLKTAGQYERTHQVVLFVLFQNGLAEQLGLPPCKQVCLEYGRGLFDIALDHGVKPITGIEVKTWSDVSENQAGRQRQWAEVEQGRILYVLMGWSEFEGPPGARIANERWIGVAELHDAIAQLAEREPREEVRGLAAAYARWLAAHVQERQASLEHPPWSRLQFSMFYNQIRRIFDYPSSIYKVDNPNGGRCILNFNKSWEQLNDDRVPGAMLFWELVDGVPHFKFGPVPKATECNAARAVRDELRGLLIECAREHSLELKPMGRLGEHMSIVRVNVDLRKFWRKSGLEVEGVLGVLNKCRAIHDSALNAWRA